MSFNVCYRVEIMDRPSSPWLEISADDLAEELAAAITEENPKDREEERTTARPEIHSHQIRTTGKLEEHPVGEQIPTTTGSTTPIEPKKEEAASTAGRRTPPNVWRPTLIYASPESSRRIIFRSDPIFTAEPRGYQNVDRINFPRHLPNPGALCWRCGGL